MVTTCRIARKADKTLNLKAWLANNGIAMWLTCCMPASFSMVWEIDKSDLLINKFYLKTQQPENSTLFGVSKVTSFGLLNKRPSVYRTMYNEAVVGKRLHTPGYDIWTSIFHIFCKSTYISSVHSLSLSKYSI